MPGAYGSGLYKVELAKNAERVPLQESNGDVVEEPRNDYCACAEMVSSRAERHRTSTHGEALGTAFPGPRPTAPRGELRGCRRNVQRHSPGMTSLQIDPDTPNTNAVVMVQSIGQWLKSCRFWKVSIRISPLATSPQTYQRLRAVHPPRPSLQVCGAPVLKRLKRESPFHVIGIEGSVRH